MKRKNAVNPFLKSFVTGAILYIIISPVYSQEVTDTLKGRNIYNPHKLKPHDTTVVETKTEVLPQTLQDTVSPVLRLKSLI